MDDVRYSELKFLAALAKGEIPYFCHFSPEQQKAFSTGSLMYLEMASTLIEDLYIRFDDPSLQLLVSRLRGELAPNFGVTCTVPAQYWNDPRAAIHTVLGGTNSVPLRVTYRGLRRIEELRDLLKRDRILDPFGVLLDKRYFLPDLEDALRRNADVSVSVIYADLDNFKAVNDNFGHGAGDTVIKAYLEIVRKSLGTLGDGYRLGGDETASLLVGPGHQRAVEIAETVRKGVESLTCEYKGSKLPKVTTSIGVASSPPEKRTADIESVADARNVKAKKAGKNQVVAE